MSDFTNKMKSLEEMHDLCTKISIAIITVKIAVEPENKLKELSNDLLK